MKLPSAFNTKPWSSIFRKSEYESIAQNIIIILKRTGDKWRELSWEEYVIERKKDTHFQEGEKMYFDKIVGYTTSPEQAAKFSNTWKEIFES